MFFDWEVPLDFREAEKAALAWMRRNEFVGAKLTPRGADGGIDVISETAVAQVKAEATSTGRPAVQRIHGVAANQGRKSLFFSTAGYTIQATEWADEAGVSLFLLVSSSTVIPVNVHGSRIVDGRTASARNTVARSGVSLGRAASGSTGTPIDLRFTLRDCDSCGRDSPVAIGCQHCGSMLPSEDVFVSDRRRFVEAARARVGDVRVGATSLTANETFLAFGNARSVERQLQLVAEIDGADPAWESRYAENIRDFARIRARSVKSSSRTDPAWASLWPRIDEMFQSAADVLDAYERCITASSPELAAQYAETAQRTLDQLTLMVRDFGRHRAELARTMQVRDAAGASANASGCLSAVFLVFAVLVSAVPVLIV